MSPSPSLEAKIVVLGSQSVGKTSLVHRYVQNAWIDPRKVHPSSNPCDVGATAIQEQAIFRDTSIDHVQYRCNQQWAHPF
jgi:signal recognition particle receptor subunit beta